ncbi:hypothetical protein CYMTET_23029 [Cymbomonas tetramitiformis]|uniref:ABC transmembrane type-1 domain-containing protein n=1 Tax=Cymbomonas tetramitiformis TaxID=36881 RepID=A0AAE0L1M1_9CHLO|nr:hypothetical protein CYMTET_23029 [Cymbomonas tetramitiformis]
MLSGLCTVRAFGHEERFLREHCLRIDDHTRAEYFLWISNRWLSIRLQLLSTAVSTLVGCYIVFGYTGLGAVGTVGRARAVGQAVMQCVRQHASVEMSMNYVERCDEFCRIEQEAAAVVDGNRPPPGWPNRGAIDIRELTVKYASTRRAL